MKLLEGDANRIARIKVLFGNLHLTSFEGEGVRGELNSRIGQFLLRSLLECPLWRVSEAEMNARFELDRLHLDWDLSSSLGD